MSCGAANSTGTLANSRSRPSHWIERQKANELRFDRGARRSRSVLLLALGGLAWFLFTKALTSPPSQPRGVAGRAEDKSAADRQARVSTLLGDRLAAEVYREEPRNRRNEILSAIDEALRQREAEVNRLKEVRRKIEERLKASGEDRAAADPPPVASPSTYSVTSEAEGPWLLWTGGAAIAITGVRWLTTWSAYGTRAPPNLHHGPRKAASRRRL